MKRISWMLVPLATALAPLAAASADDPAPTFPFVIPGFDSSPSPIDMSFLNKEPAGAHGFVTIKNGHFVDGSGKRLRLLGTNFTFAGAFPPKESAPKVAAHLRKLGVNVVRFHHMDNRTAPGGIWLPGQKGLDPEQLDRLDWIIYQLKLHGIYTNINLHVSRNYPGLPAEDASRAFNYGKVLDNFHKPFIDMQREYAKALLTHVNRYTGKAYAHEPAVAVVEINNENTLLGTNWATLRTMPEPFLSDLTRQWRHWLQQRYHTTAALRKAWNEGSEPLGQEMLANGDFKDGMAHWNFERSSDSVSSLNVVPEGPAPGTPALCIETTKPGEVAWNFQLHQVGMTLQEGALYTLSFMARAAQPEEIAVNSRIDQNPWSSCGLGDDAALTTEWQRFTYTFRARGVLPAHVRVSLGLKNQLGKFWIARMSLRRGGMFGLPAEQSLEANNIPLPPASAAPSEQLDFWSFLAETERAYVRDFIAYLKKDLKVQASIVDTQASYGGIGGVYRDATLCDYVDMHAYWQHPSFPVKPWDSVNWLIRNTSMVADPVGGTLFYLAIHRVVGKPFSVSEYDHPAPSFYTAELFPMLASFAAFQDWDALYQFDYGNTAEESDRISGFFTMCANPAKLAFLPIAAILFRGGAVQPGGEPAILTLPADKLPTQLLEHGTSASEVWLGAGADKSLPLRRKVAVRVIPGNGPVRLSPGAADEKAPRRSETGQIAWEAEPKERALYTVNTPTVRAAVGYLGGRTLKLGDLSLTMAATPSNWASVALAALDGKPLAQSRRMLLAAVGRVENTEMGWNEDHTSVGRNWGHGPTRAEGIPLQISLPGAVSACRALDGAGHEQQAVPVQKESGRSLLAVGPQYQTVWYYLTR